MEQPKCEVGARPSFLAFSRFSVAVRSSDDGAIQPNEVSSLPFMLILHETVLFLDTHVRDVISERLGILREADSIFISSLKEAGLYDQVWQALAVLTPVRSVSAVGDERRYGYILALRAVTNVYGMTADWSRLPHEFLDQVAARITRSIPQIGRVVYDITSKPPATIEWE